MVVEPSYQAALNSTDGERNWRATHRNTPYKSLPRIISVDWKSTSFDRIPPLDTRQIDEIAQRLAMTLPPGLKSLRNELADNFRAILQNQLERLDLVSRDQFEAQAALLSRTSARLKTLETRLEALETGQRQRN